MSGHTTTPAVTARHPAQGPAAGGRPLSVLYSFPHAIGAPGIGWTAWNHVHELVRAGHRVHLVTTSVARPVAGLASLSLTLAVGSRRLPHRVLGRDRALAWHDRRAASLVRTLDVDVVHGWPLSFVRTARAASARGLPALREVPNTHTEHAYAVVTAEVDRLGMRPPKGSPHSANPRRLALETREWDEATALLVPSDAVAQTFLDRGYPPHRLLRHQYGYRPEAFGGPAGEPAARRPERPFTAVFVGRLEPRKGLHHALRAWRTSSAARDGHLHVYGSLVPGYLDVLGDLLDQPGVELRPFADDVAAVFAEADVMLLPTLEEGSALVTYEAQAAGCVPLVSTASGALLEHGVHGLVHEPGDVTSLAGHLSALHDDPALLATLRAGAIRHRPELSWEAASRRIVDAYRAAQRLADGGAHANR